MQREEAAWAAGLFEGEGCVTTSGGYRRLQIAMNDEDVLRLFVDRVGEGKLYGPYRNASMERIDGFTRKLRWFWLAQEEAALRVAEQLLPWLGERRREKVLSTFPELT